MLGLGSGPRTRPESRRSELGAGCGTQAWGHLPGHQGGRPPPTSGFLLTGSQLHPLLGVGVIIRKWVPGLNGHPSSLSDGGGGGGGKTHYMGTSALEGLRSSPRYHPLCLTARLESPRPAGVTPTGNSATPFLRPHVPLLALPFGVARLEEAAH